MDRKIVWHKVLENKNELADALRRQQEKGKLKYIGIRHEGAGAFAASAYGKLTGKPAACFSIAGPGATNMFTGLWDAKVDRTRILALTGQVATQVVGTGNFQEADLVRAFQTVAEFNQRVQNNSKHTELMTLDIKLILLNNNELGKISKEQRAGRFDVFATELYNPDFSEFANSCGALGIRVTQKEKLEDAMGKVLNYKGTALLEIMTDVALV